MALTEQRILNQVTLLPQSNSINVQWSNQVIRDGYEVISETYERKAYGQDQKAQFIAEVEGGIAYATAMGW